MKISLCMITKNEEKNIARSISSCKGIADEVIVVDSESTDQTVKIATELGAKVFIRPWTGDFAAARNYAIDKATGDWVIILDADEYFGEGQEHIVRNVVKKAQDDGNEFIYLALYEINERINTVFATDYSCRIFKNDGTIRYRNKVHEWLFKLDGSDMKKTSADNCTVYHTGYDPSIIEKKLKRNLEHLVAKDAMKDDYSRYYYMAECYFGLQKYEECIEQLGKLFSLPKFDEKLYTSQKMFRAYLFQVGSMIILKQKYSEQEIFQFVTRTIDDFGKHPEIRLSEASYNMSYYRIDAAIKAIDEAVEMEKCYDSPYDFMKITSDEYKNLIWLYKMKNDLHKARKTAISILGENEHDDSLMHTFFKLLHGLQTEDKMVMIDEAFDTGDMGNLAKIMAQAWISGNSDVFSVYLLEILKRQPEIANDHSILYKIYLLQKNYQGVIDIASMHEGDKAYDDVSSATRFASGKQIFFSSFEDVLPVALELLRSGDCEAAKRLIDGELMREESADDRTIGYVSAAEMFESFAQGRYASKLRLIVARQNSDEKVKGAQYVNAAHMSYYSGDFEDAVNILEEALPYAIAGNHLAIEILCWIGEKCDKKDRQMKDQIRDLTKRYESEYQKTYVKPLK